MRSHVRISSHTLNAEGEAESGGRRRRETTSAIEETTLEGPVEKAKNEFRRSMQKVFSDNNTVNRIMVTIGTQEDYM